MTPSTDDVKLEPCPFCGGPARMSSSQCAHCVNDACDAEIYGPDAATQWNRRADRETRRTEDARWLAFDIGCIECGEESAVIGLFKTEAEAEAACTTERAKQAADWHGQHIMEVFNLDVAIVAQGAEADAS